MLFVDHHHDLLLNSGGQLCDQHLKHVLHVWLLLRVCRHSLGCGTCGNMVLHASTCHMLAWYWWATCTIPQHTLPTPPPLNTHSPSTCLVNQIYALLLHCITHMPHNLTHMPHNVTHCLHLLYMCSHSTHSVHNSIQSLLVAMQPTLTAGKDILHGMVYASHGRCHAHGGVWDGPCCCMQQGPCNSYRIRQRVCILCPADVLLLLLQLDGGQE